MAKVKAIAIRGAGMAGLSIARELLKMSPETSITLFDVRPRLPHPQRTFCFFRKQSLPNLPKPSAEWNTVTFKGADFERSIDVSSKPYTMIKGDDFFQETLEQLESAGVAFHWSCREVHINKNSIRTESETFTFDLVIDTAFKKENAVSMAWQSFAGIWVRTEHAVFDPSRAILMEIIESTPEAPVSFFYVLPTTATTALVEHTTFSTEALTADYHFTRCHAWLANHVRSPVTVESSEHGAIPMGLQIPKPAGPITLGSSAGAIRPATGYAFVTVQKQAELMAEQIFGNNPQTIEAHHPFWLTFGDRLFLRALRASPTSGQTMMTGLLSKCPDDRLISFLCDDVTLTEAISVWCSIPKRTMMKALLCG